MEVPLAPAHRGPILWKELLLAVSLLTLWSPPTTAQLTIPSVNATEGKDVLLLVHSLPENLFGYAWYRGERVDSNHRIASYVIETQNTTPGPAHSGQEKIYLNGSLLFQNVTLKDTGYYTVQAIRKDLQTEVATGQLRVYQNDYTGYPVETIAGILIGVLILVALATFLGYFRYRRRTERASDSRGLTEHRPSASTPGQGPSGTSTSPGPLPNTRTAGPIYEDLLHPSTDVYGRISPRADGAS
ncbi:cell adhesion molecule CEACAM3 isoform 2-T2 [Glossophaga mutica]